MKINLNSGDTRIAFDVPGTCSFINTKSIDCNVDRERFILELKELINDFVDLADKNILSIALVVADKTRLSQFQKFMPWIEKALSESCIPAFELEIFIAYGSHPRQSGSESLTAYGDYFQKYKFVHHDARANTFRDFGTTAAGTRILINEKLFNEHDLVITYGAISHHYFAGFGGGRKLLFPGLAALSSIRQNHALFLDFPTKSLQENCQSGKLDGNPLAEDLAEIYEKLPATIGIHTILNRLGEVCQFEIGADYDTFLKACEKYSNYYKIESGNQFDMVIASTGGYPKDINFIQSHKSIHTAAKFVKDGGKLIVFAECRDGIGNDKLFEIFKLGDWNKIFPEGPEGYENNTGTALAQLAKSKRIKIHTVTSLDEETCRLLGMHKTDHSKVQEMINNHTGSIGIIEYASLVY